MVVAAAGEAERLVATGTAGVELELEAGSDVENDAEAPESGETDDEPLAASAAGFEPDVEQAVNDARATNADAMSTAGRDNGSPGIRRPELR